MYPHLQSTVLSWTNANKSTPYTLQLVSVSHTPPPPCPTRNRNEIVDFNFSNISVMLQLFQKNCCSRKGGIMFQNRTCAWTIYDGNRLVLEITPAALMHKSLCAMHNNLAVILGTMGWKPLYQIGANIPNAASGGQPRNCMDLLLWFNPACTRP